MPIESVSKMYIKEELYEEECIRTIGVSIIPKSVRRNHMEKNPVRPQMLDPRKPCRGVSAVQLFKRSNTDQPTMARFHFQ